LTGFLLTLPFQQRFYGLGSAMRIVYLVTVVCSMGATILLVAPVGMHRLLFRRHKLRTLVSSAHKCAVAGLVLLGAALVGVSVLIFYVVEGPLAGTIAGICTGVPAVYFWIVLPLWHRRSGEDSAYEEPTLQH
jgi:hypothetical protein